jgi:hypothetical protein
MVRKNYNPVIKKLLSFYFESNKAHIRVTHMMGLVGCGSSMAWMGLVPDQFHVA